MAVYSPRLWWLVVALLLAPSDTQSREITLEDIRDAMMSIVQVVRMSEDKLERHEYREKALGEQIKKMLAGLEKRHKALEPFKGMISRLDSRLSNVETILLQKEEREKKTDQALDGIQKSLQTLTSSMEDLKPKPTEIDNNLTAPPDDAIERRLDTTDAKIEAVKNQIEALKNSFNTENLRTVCLGVASEMNPFERHLNETEHLLYRYEAKLSEYNGTKLPPPPPVDAVQLNEVALADEAWHSKMTEEMEKQGKEITKVQKLLSDAESMWKDLPKLSDIHIATNQTVAAVTNASDTLKQNEQNGVETITTKLRELSDRLLATNEDIQLSLTQGNTLAERAFGELSITYEALRKELQAVTKNDQVILQMSDNVIATKKRIEYGIHEIVIKVKDLISKYVGGVNTTLTGRLSSIEAKVLESQGETHANLTTKIESEITQVWRQVGVMHEQIRNSKDALDKLSEGTELYVNSSTKTMGKVKDDVSHISGQMESLSDNLNYALGRLEMAMQEFNQISAKVAGAIASLKTDDRTEPKPEVGPGPHAIPSDGST